MTKEQRRSIERAEMALAKYVDCDVYAEPRQHVVDLMTDLQHYCDELKIDWDAALFMAVEHAEAEREEGGVQ